MNQESTQRLYFPNLDALRFFAASLVMIHHIELYKNLFQKDNYYSNGFIQIAGKVGVVLFFVLSGFLIFSLLMREQNRNGAVSTKLFYFRRILRIWPLYFLIVGLAFFVFPYISVFNLNVNYAQSKFLAPVLYSAMLPNVACAMYLIVPYAGQVWSLGIEEQMYLISPWVVNAKKMLIVLVFIILVTVGLKFFIWLRADDDNWMSYLYWFNNFSYDCIAIGALTACFAFQFRNKTLEFLFSSWAQAVVWILTLYLLFSGTFFRIYQFEVFSVLFAVIILNLAFNKKSLVRFEQPILNYLGRISYGLYMFHGIVIVLVIRLLDKLGFYHPALTYLLVFGFTIFISGLSYQFFEKKFIAIKDSLNPGK